jgi:hypothetical protein
MDGKREIRVACEGVCPRCTEGPHPKTLVVGLSRGVLLFGGPGKSMAGALATATLTCPNTALPFEVTLNVPAMAGERVAYVRVLDASDVNAEEPIPESSETTTEIPEPATIRTMVEAVAGEREPDWRVGELADWRKGSAEQARDAAGKLLAAGTAAIGAYFAILKVVAGDAVHGFHLAIAVLPAIGYLVVCVLAVTALRPVLVRIWTPDELERFIDDRLKQLNLLISAAVLVFVLSTGLAVVAFAVTLR